MNNLETRFYTYPPIPLADITPLERLVLTHVLECSETEAGLVLFTDVGPVNPINVKRQALLDAFGAWAPQADSALNAFIGSCILALLPTSPDGDDIAADIDLSEFPWQSIVHDIVARSPSLPEVTVIQWMNHPSSGWRPMAPAFRSSLLKASVMRPARNC